jgi:putative flavoprotein involved in K+ transport
VLDCVVIGAGPAGLAASEALTGAGVDHVVLERGRVGESWRSARWDSFRLNTPGWMSRMLRPPGEQVYLDRAQVWAALDALAASGAEVRPGTDVVGVDPADDGFLLRTSQSPVHARAVVVATGDQNVPRVPDLASTLPSWIAQLHTAQYRSAAELPEGAVLVVGTGQSGCQLAADLLDAGREVYVSTSAVARLPTPYRGRESLHWLVSCGFYDHRTVDVTDPAVRRAPNPLIAPAGLPLGLPTLARRGATLLGRPTGVTGDRVQLDATATSNVAVGEEMAARLRMLMDAYIETCGDVAPAAEPDPDDEPVHVRSYDEIDLRARGVTSVVWCTGFRGDTSWMPEAWTRDGGPVTDGVSGAVDGLWYVGLRWLTHRASSILHGFPRDAATVAAQVSSYVSTPR